MSRSPFIVSLRFVTSTLGELFGRRGSEEEAELTVEVDGAYGEGGGQILRVSLALSALTSIPVHLRNIRVKRSPSGLRAQHRTAVEAVAQLSNATVKGLELGSTELKFIPGQLRGGRLILDTGTAGSTTLVLQSLLPAMLFCEGRVDVEVRGGTNNPLAPAIDYLQRVFTPTLSLMGLDAKIELVRRGFYPRGGGIVRAGLDPVKTIQAIKLERFDKASDINGIAYSSRLPSHIVSRMVKSVQEILQHARFGVGRIDSEIVQQGDPRCALSPGCGILLTTKVLPLGVLGADSLGALGKSAEKVGEEAAKASLQLIEEKVPVDPHLADQLIIYMALAKGNSRIRVSELTPHTESCIHVCEYFFGRLFTVTKETSNLTSIACNGAAFAASERGARRSRLP